MKSIPKTTFLLLGLVLTVYLARQSDFSFSGAVTSTLRRLANEYRPSADLCAGVDLNNPISESQAKKADSFKKTLQGIRGGNPLKDVVAKGTTDGAAEDYGVPLIGVVAPWIVLFFITYFACCGICCNWCCMYGICKKCKVCKCCKEPKESKKKVVFAGFAAVLLVCVFGASIAGITFSSGVSQGMDLTLCSFLNVVENLAYGKPADKWIGISGAIGALDTIITKFDNTVTSLNGIQTQIDDVNNALADALTATQVNLYNANKNEQAVRPDPNQSGAQYKPLYIDKLGPETDSSTFSGAIATEMKTKQQLVNDAAVPINDAVNELKNQQASIKSAIQSGRDAASDINSQIVDILDSIKDAGTTVKDVTKIIGAALAGVFGANLGLAVFAFTSMVMVGVLKIKFFNKLLHLSWCVTFILTLLGFLLSTLTYPLSVVMMEVCDVVTTALNDQAYFDQTFNTFSSGNDKAKSTIHTCFFTADGNILGEFNVENQIGQFDTIFDNLDSISSEFDINSDVPPASVVIPVQQDLVAKFKDGREIDGEASGVDLVTLNNYAKKSKQSCFAYEDTWALNSANCASGDGTKFIGATHNDRFDITAATCVGFDQWMTPAHTISNRYTSGDVTCSNQGALTSSNYAQTFITNFVTNRNRVATIFGNVESALNLIETKHDAFALSLVEVFKKLRVIKTNLADIQDSLVGPQNGLIANARCTFIKNDLKSLTDSMCVGFISSLYQTSVLIILTSFFSLFSTIAVFCLAKRFLTEGGKKVSP